MPFIPSALQEKEIALLRIAGEFQAMNERRPFDTEGYRGLLKKYKTRNPDKLFDQLLSEGESDSDE